MVSRKTLPWSTVALAVVLGVAQAGAASFNGTWIVERNVQGDCLDKRRSFTVTISNNTFKAGGRTVTIAPSGDFTFTSDRVEGHPTVYAGKLTYKSGSGTFKNTKGCIGTFTMHKK
jgi:hypothetical protein